MIYVRMTFKGEHNTLRRACNDARVTHWVLRHFFCVMFNPISQNTPAWWLCRLKCRIDGDGLHNNDRRCLSGMSVILKTESVYLTLFIATKDGTCGAWSVFGAAFNPLTLRGLHCDVSWDDKWRLELFTWEPDLRMDVNVRHIPPVTACDRAVVCRYVSGHHIQEHVRHVCIATVDSC